MTDLALCGSKNSRSEYLVVWNSSWNRFLCSARGLFWLAVPII
jgi:hypothetical protein